VGPEVSKRVSILLSRHPPRTSSSRAAAALSAERVVGIGSEHNLRTVPQRGPRPSSRRRRLPGARVPLASRSSHSSATTSAIRSPPARPRRTAPSTSSPRRPRASSGPPPDPGGPSAVRRSGGGGRRCTGSPRDRRILHRVREHGPLRGPSLRIGQPDVHGEPFQRHPGPVGEYPPSRSLRKRRRASLASVKVRACGSHLSRLRPRTSLTRRTTANKAAPLPGRAGRAPPCMAFWLRPVSSPVAGVRSRPPLGRP